jgi:hypothetical protein
LLGKRVQRVESALHPGGLAPKRLRNETMGQFNQGRQQKRGVSRRRGGTGRRGQGHGKWSMPGFSVDPGGGVLVAGRYTVEAVQSRVIQQGQGDLASSWSKKGDRGREGRRLDAEQ